MHFWSSLSNQTLPHSQAHFLQVTRKNLGMRLSPDPVGLARGGHLYVSRVEAFATRTKLEASDQALFGGRSRDQCGFRATKSCDFWFYQWFCANLSRLISAVIYGDFCDFIRWHTRFLVCLSLHLHQWWTPNALHFGLQICFTLSTV